MRIANVGSSFDSISSSLPQGSHEIARRMLIISAFGARLARNQFAVFIAYDNIFAVFSRFFDFIEAKLHSVVF